MLPYFGIRSGYAIKMGRTQNARSLLKTLTVPVRYFKNQDDVYHYIFGKSYASRSERKRIRRNNLALVVYTDGGQRNFNDGAWAYSINGAHRQLAFRSRYLNTKNNNYCEMEAVIQALQDLKRHGWRKQSLQLDTDSNSVESLTSDIRHGESISRIAWNTDWKIGQLRKLKRLLHSFKYLHIHQIKGHAGILGNQFVDQLCSRAMCQRYSDAYDPFRKIY